MTWKCKSKKFESLRSRTLLMGIGAIVSVLLQANLVEPGSQCEWE